MLEQALLISVGLTRSGLCESLEETLVHPFLMTVLRSLMEVTRSLLSTNLFTVVVPLTSLLERNVCLEVKNLEHPDCN